MSPTRRRAHVILLELLLFSAACTSMPVTPPRIELLGFPGCPNTPTLRANLASALETLGGGWTCLEVNQEQLPEHDLRRGYPTPTILVDGRDLYGMPTPTGTALGCRVYEGGVPDADELARRLRAAAGR